MIKLDDDGRRESLGDDPLNGSVPDTHSWVCLLSACIVELCNTSEPVQRMVDGVLSYGVGRGYK